MDYNMSSVMKDLSLDSFMIKNATSSPLKPQHLKCERAADALENMHSSR